MEKAPHKKEDLTIANHVLKLASKLLKVALRNMQICEKSRKARWLFSVGYFISEPIMCHHSKRYLCLESLNAFAIGWMHLQLSCWT